MWEYLNVLLKFLSEQFLIVATTFIQSLMFIVLVVVFLTFLACGITWVDRTRTFASVARLGRTRTKHDASMLAVQKVQKFYDIVREIEKSGDFDYLYVNPIVGSERLHSVTVEFFPITVDVDISKNAVREEGAKLIFAATLRGNIEVIVFLARLSLENDSRKHLRLGSHSPRAKISPRLVHKYLIDFLDVAHYTSAYEGHSRWQALKYHFIRLRHAIILSRDAASILADLGGKILKI